MSIAEQSLAHDSGEDVEVVFTHAGDDITGWSIRFRLFDHAGTQVLEKTVGDGITINSTHQYTLDLTGDSADLVPDKYYGVIRRTDNDEGAVLAKIHWRVWGVYD